MNKPNLTLWHVPMDVVPAIMEALKRECCCAIHTGRIEEADELLYCIKGIKKDYDEALAEYERLLEPEPEEEGDEDE